MNFLDLGKNTQNNPDRFFPSRKCLIFESCIYLSDDASSLAPGSLDFDTVLTFPFMAPVGIVTSENLCM